MAFRHDVELVSGVQTANTKASWFKKKKKKAIHEWTPDCHNFLFFKLVL